jgi:hypothetical protein
MFKASAPLVAMALALAFAVPGAAAKSVPYKGTGKAC